MLTKEQLKRLECAINPRSVMVVGATKEPHRVGYSLLESVVMGGYKGRILPIHPRHGEILGQKVYSSAEAAGENPDLAIIALNEKATIDFMDTCGKFDVKGALCVAGGYSEVGDQGQALQLSLKQAAEKNNVLVIGPNTLGLINAEASLNATFWPTELERGGKVSVITQSGGVGQMILCQAKDEGLPINKWIGVGNRVTLDFDDYLQFLANDTTTKVIAVFIEGTDRARTFVEMAQAVVQDKPVVILKAGQSNLTQRFSLTHTGSMGGSYEMYRDIFEQFNLIPAKNVSDLVSISKALAIAPRPKGTNLAVITPTAGPSLLLIDELDGSGCNLPEFSPTTMRKLNAMFSDGQVVLKNPLDTAAVGYSGENYLRLTEILLDDPNVDLLVAISTEHKNRIFPAAEIVELSHVKAKPIIVSFVGSHGNEKSEMYRQVLQSGGVPFYLSIPDTAAAVRGLIKVQKPTHTDNPRINQSHSNSRPGSVHVLLDNDAKQLLAHQRIPTTRFQVVATHEDALKFADEIGYPVVLKGITPLAIHKSEVGGVLLNLMNPEQLIAGFKQLRQKLEALDPGVKLMVEEMVQGQVEVIVGVTTDNQFGKVLICGMGGIFTEVLHDIHYGMIPVSEQHAKKMINSLRGAQLLQGYRRKPRVDIDALIRLMLSVSEMVIDNPQIEEIDLNPVILSENMAVVVDARIIIRVEEKMCDEE
jgi:acetyl-CoA synthetase (ADP-forming)